jgi:hypothetical protein
MMCRVTSVCHSKRPWSSLGKNIIRALEHLTGVAPTKWKGRRGLQVLTFSWRLETPDCALLWKERLC